MRYVKLILIFRIRGLNAGSEEHSQRGVWASVGIDGELGAQMMKRMAPRAGINILSQNV